MKTLLVLIATFILFTTTITAQVFVEDFESTIGMTSNPSVGGWGVNTRLYSQGLKSDSGRVILNDTNILTTTSSFSTLGLHAVYLDFDHICKVQFGDSSIIEVSNDNGLNWQRVTGSQYLGSAVFAAIGDRFTEASYGTFWDPTGPTTPQQSWWKPESFDISALAGNSANVKIRFKVLDGNGNGAIGRAGWFLDNIVVNASISEVIPPLVTLVSPIASDTVFSDSPVTVKASISDNSGIDSAYCIVSCMPFGEQDTILLVHDANTVDTFSCQIPFYGFGRTTSYYVVAYDGSFSHNADSTSTYSYITKYTTGGTAEIGTGTLNSSYPFYTYYNDSRSQFIYTAAEINTSGAYAGPIASIAFNVISASTQAMNGFSIKMKNTSTNTLSGFETGLSLVYSPTSYTVADTGWQTINLTTPFIWDGVSNLLIEVCFDNTSYTSNSGVYSTYETGKTWGNKMDGGTGCSLTGGNLQSNRPNIKIDILGSSALTNDLGVQNILNPTTGIIAGNDFAVKVDLKNFGVDTIRTGQISWTFDGINQTPYILSATDSILPDNVMSPIILDTLTSTVGGHTIVAWSEMPNGVTDKNIINDTAQYSFYGCVSSLSGSYTIGGSTANFVDFAEAILALKQCGISGAVTFNVNNGVYNEQLLINDILGISSTNTVSFQSTSGDSSTVTIKHTAIDANDNFVVKIDSVSNISFSNMTFETLDNDFTTIFVLSNDISNININNNIIKAETNDNDYNISSLIIGNVGNNINISNNSFINAASAIRLSADVQGINWEINNNIFQGQSINGIYVSKAKSIKINNNVMHADTTLFTNLFTGIELQNNTSSAVIKENEIYSTICKSSIGLNISSCLFNSSNRTTIINNFIQVKGSNTTNPLTAGLLIDNSTNINIYYNTINIIGNQDMSAAVLIDNATANASKNLTFTDNIISNIAGGYTFYVENLSTNLWNNTYNDLWNNTGSTKFAYFNSDISDIANWQTTSGGTNTFNINPYFVSYTDIHIINNAMNGIGTSISGITTDIDGDIRNINTPDIGADEFDPSPWDATILEFTSFNEGCGLTNEAISIKIKNLGNVDINGNFTASYRLSHSATVVTEAISSLIATGDTLIYTFTTLANLNVYPYGKDSTFNIEAWVDLQSDPIANNDSSFIDITSSYTPLPPVVSDTLISYGNSVNLTAISTDSLIWFQTDTSIVELSRDRWYQTPALFDTTTYWVGTTTGGSDFKITETVQYKGASGATSPYPTYLPSSDFDGIEITNLGSSDGNLSGYTINYHSNNTFSYTFPANTIIASGEVVLAVYGTSLTVGPAGNNVFYTSNTSVNSSDQVSYWLTDNLGNVVDAFASNGATFPSTSPVTSSDFGGDLLGGSSHPGAVRTISDNNDASDWQVINPAIASFGTANSNLTIVSQVNNGCHSTLMPLTVEVNNIPQNDISLTQLISPSSGYYLNSNTNVKVKLANYGSIAKDTIPLAYQLNSSSIVYDTLFQTLNSGETADFTFGQTIDLSQFGSYNFNVYTNLSYDTEHTNDSILEIITNDSLIYCPSYATSISDTRIDEVVLEDINNNTSTTGCATYSNFSSISTLLLAGVDYQISVTVGTCNGNYTKGAKAWIDFNNDGDFEDPNEEIADFGISSTTLSSTVSFNVPSNATLGIHKLRVVGRETSNSNNIDPCGTYGYGETEEYSIIITPQIQFDASIQSILNVADTNYEGANITPIVVVKNYGYDTLSSFNISYSLNGNTPIVYNYVSNLAPFQSDTVTLASFNNPAGSINLCAYSSVSLDVNNVNDTACLTYYGVPTKDAKALAIQDIDLFCGMMYDTVKVQLTNIGIDTINSSTQTTPTTISYQSNLLSPITEIFTQSVAPGDTVWYQFSNLVYVGSNNLMDSIYNIKAWINFVGDYMISNDTAKTIVESLHTPSSPSVITPVITPYASPVTLIATNSAVDTLIWYDDSLSSDGIFGGSPYITPWLNFNDTTFWVASLSQGAPTSITIGIGATTNSSTGYPSPYANYYWGNKEQYLILASELLASGALAGEISELAFDVANVNSCVLLQNYEIMIGNSTQTNLSSFETGLTTVYSNAAGYLAVNGWNNHEFTTPFLWDGISNIVIQICSQNTSYTTNASVKLSSTLFTSTRYKYADANNVCNYTTSSSSSLRPNMKMTVSSIGCNSSKVPVNISILPQSACDVGASNLVGPLNAVYLSSTETIKAEIQNYGTVDQTSVPISYQINGGSIITETASVPASSSIIYSFNTKADLSSIGAQYNVKLTTSLACDTTSLNNSFEGSIKNIIPVYCNSSATYTTYHDIENVTLGGINNTSLSPFDKQYTDFTNISPGILHPGNSVSIAIKIHSLSTTPSGGFVKIYIDYNKDEVFDPVTELAAGIPYNNASSSTPAMAYGSLSVPSNVDLGLTRMRIVAVRNGTAVTVGPCGTYSHGETEDYSVYIANTIPSDAGISEIITPNAIVTTASVPVSVRVYNYGTNPMSSVDIRYSVNNNTPSIINYNSTTLYQGDYVDVSLGNVALSGGMNNICAETILIGDSNTFNDNSCTGVFKEASVNLIYTDNFESNNLWMPDTVSNDWQLGVPSMSTINSAHSPNNVWATNLSGSYNGGLQYLYSPKFIITNNIDTAQLKFWHWYNTEGSNDGAFIQYKKNNELWVSLGYISDSRATNWYNYNIGGIYMFSGNSGGWVKSTFELDFTTGEFSNTDTLQFRYILSADNSNNNYDGWAIDDFEMSYPAQPNDVGISSINNSTNHQMGDIINVSVDIHNFGTNAQTSIPVWYKFNNGATITETFTPTSGSLAPNASESFTFTQTNVQISTSSFTICSGTNLSSDMYQQNDEKCQNFVATTGNTDVGVIGVYKTQMWGGEDTTSIFSQVDLYAIIENFGLDTITTFNIEYTKDNSSTWNTETWNGNLTYGEVDTFHFANTYNSPLGNYNVCVRTVAINDANTNNDEFCKSYIGVSIGNTNDLEFSISQNRPNPAHGNIKINYIIPYNGDVKFKLRNTLGQIVYFEQYSASTGNNIIELNTKNMSNGVYYYTVIFENKRLTRKMIISK